MEIRTTTELISASPMMIEAKDRIIRDADELIQYRLYYDNPWDMEQCPTPYAVTAGKLRLPPNADPEWVFSLARLEYLNRLTWAYNFTGDKKYAEFWRAFLTDFWYPNVGSRKKETQLGNFRDKVYRKLGLPYAVNVNRTLDTAIRLYTVAVGMRMREAAGITDGHEQVTVQLKRDERFLDGCPATEFTTTSNWGIIILANRICAALALEWKRNFDDDMDKLLSMTGLQVTKSGIHIEGSPMYQVQMTICLLRVIYWYRRRGMSVPGELESTVKAMVDYLYALTGPDNYQQTIGDSDRTEMSSFFLMACHTLGTKKYAAGILRPDDLMLLADMPEALEEYLAGDYAQVEKTADEGWRMEFFSGENTAIFKRNKDMVTCINAQHLSGHSHADSGSVTVYLNGYPAIIDAGRYSYVNSAIRRELKGPAAHNILSLDGGVEWHADDAWIYTKKTAAPRGEASYINGAPYVRMDWKGAGAEFTRWIITLPEGILIEDLIRCNGNHTLSEFFNFDPDVEVTKSEDIAISREGLSAKLQTRAKGDIDKAPISYGYNQLTSGKRLTLSTPFTDIGTNEIWIGSENMPIESSLKNNAIELTLGSDSRKITLDI